MRAVWLLIFLLVALPTHAQDAAVAGLQTASGAFADTNGEVTADLTLFSHVWDAVVGPLDGWLRAVHGTLIGQFGDVLRLATAISIVTGMLSILLSDWAAAHAAYEPVLKGTVRAAIIIGLLSSATAFQSLITDPMMHIADDISQAILVGTGQPVAHGGGQFDALAKKIIVGTLNAAKSLSIWQPEGWVPGLSVFLAAGLSFLAIGFIFYRWVIAFVMLSLAAAMAPLAVACLCVRPTRHLFQGWLAAVVSIILFQILLAALLSLLLMAIQIPVVLVAEAGPKSNLFGMVFSMFGATVLLVLGAAAAGQVQDLAVGIAGGVYVNTAHFATTVNSAIRSGGNLFGGGGSSSGAAASGSVTTTTRATAPVGGHMGGTRP